MVTDVNDELSKLVPEPWNPAPDPNTIRAAVARGANVNAIDSGGDSIVQRFIQNCRDPVVDTVQLLVELGADVNYQDTDGFCALSTAVFRHEPPLIACLLEAGANPNIILERHESILDMAEGDLEFHSFELNYDPQSEHNRKACAALKEIITILRSAGAKRALEMKAARPRDWLVIFASYDSGLFTRDGFLQVDDLPSVSQFCQRFKAWLAEHFDPWPKNKYDDMPQDFDRMAHNLAGRRLAVEIKQLVGAAVDVEYVCICPESETNGVRNVKRESV